MKLTPLTAVFGFVLIVVLAGLLTGAWFMGAFWGWLVGVVSAAAAIGLLASQHHAAVESDKRYEAEQRIRDQNYAREEQRRRRAERNPVSRRPNDSSYDSRP